MPDILSLLASAIGRLADTSASSRSPRAGWVETAAAGRAKWLNNKTVPVVPAAKQGAYPTTAEPSIAAFARECDAPSRVSSFFTGSTGSTGSSEDFCGFQSSRDCIADGDYGNSALAAALDPSLHEGIPAAWVHGITSLRTMACPARVRPERWRQLVADAGQFLDSWGVQARSLNWTTLDIFGCHPTHPLQRLDCAGLITLLRGDQVVALADHAARIRTRSGAALTYYRRPRPTAVPLWQLAPPVDPAADPPIEALDPILREAKRLFPDAIVTIREATLDWSTDDKNLS